ncbi:CHAT domain-containing protein [Mycena pura]|uniref:CHAT domain-containing protein n=1 Tax=Mycena pura TaxID=153505 RepID=A0AAD6Y6C6_9AGAR|nr:CHAT domain-containing protein [Mycena pura]
MAHRLFLECKASANLPSVESAILILEWTASHLEAADPELKQCQILLAKAFLTRFYHLGDASDVHRAFAFLGTAYGIITENILPLPQKSVSEMKSPAETMGSALEILTRFNQDFNLEILANAITLYETTLSETDDYSKQNFQTLLEVSQALVVHFHRTDNLNTDQLTKAISYMQKAVQIQPNLSTCQCAVLLTAWAHSPEPLESMYLFSEAAEALSNAVDADRTALESLQASQDLQLRDEQTLELGIANLRQALLLLSWGHVARGSILENLAMMLSIRFEQKGNCNDLDEEIELYRRILELLPASHPNRGAALNNLANKVETRFKYKGTIGDLKEGIQLHREALASRPEHHPDHLASLNNLANTIQAWFEHTNDLNSLEEAVTLYRKALALYSADHPDHSSVLNNLGRALYSQFRQKGDLNNLEEAIKLHRAALTILPENHRCRGTYLNNLGNTVQEFFRQKGNFNDLEEAITLYKEALVLRASPHPDRSTSLDNLGLALQTRFEQKGDPEDLKHAIKLLREVLTLRPLSHPKCATSSNILGLALQTQFKCRGNFEDLLESIQLHRGALALNPDGIGSLVNLAHALQILFEQKGDLDILEEAIKLLNKVLTLLPTSNPHRSIPLSSLADAFHARFKRQGDLKDLEQAAKLHRSALRLRAEPHPDRSTSLDTLALVLQTRFKQTGDFKDLDEVIELHRKALMLLPASHPRRAGSLNNLASAIHVRFKHKRDSKDLNEAIKLLRGAVVLCPSPNPYRSDCLNNLANKLQSRFAFIRDSGDLKEAIELHREALVLRSTEHLHRSISLDSLAIALQTQFAHNENSKCLDEAIQLHREAVLNCPEAHAERSGFIHNLALAMKTRFEKTSDLKDLEEAIKFHREALLLLPTPHPNRGQALSNLGSALASKYASTQLTQDIDAALAIFQEASTYSYSSPVNRLFSTHIWAQFAADHRHPTALSAYRATINMLPQIAALHLDVVSRQNVLSSLRAGRLASGAAACAIEEGDYDGAVELLEASRSIFWSQALHLRTPLHQLEMANSTLALELKELREDLEIASFRDMPRTLGPENQKEILAMEEEGFRYEKLNKRWDAVVERVRLEVPGFERFMQPKSHKALQQAAISGPVIVLLAEDSSCSALIMNQSKPVQHVRLPAMNNLSVNLQADLAQALSRSNFNSEVFIASRENGGAAMVDSELQFRLFGDREGYANVSQDDIFRRFLAELWKSIVKPIFDAINLKAGHLIPKLLETLTMIEQKSNNPPRIWWCPTGSLSFLPIHAAGIYEQGHRDCISDYVISSYTPTLNTLLDPPTDRPSSFKMTAVSQSKRPKFSQDYSALPGSKKELDSIKDQVPPAWLTTLGVASDAVVETTLFHLNQSSIVHFACHGTQNLEQPLESALILSDGPVKVSELMRRPEDTQSSETIRKSMSFAFLSACETAKGDVNTPDEAMHLAATLLFAGFRSVVATMWTMQDEDGPKIADKFYGHLFKGCNPKSDPPAFPDLRKSAEALHFAVLELREEPHMSFKRWVPFVHYGL